MKAQGIICELESKCTYIWVYMKNMCDRSKKYETNRTFDTSKTLDTHTHSIIRGFSQSMTVSACNTVLVLILFRISYEVQYSRLEHGFSGEHTKRRNRVLQAFEWNLCIHNDGHGQLLDFRTWLQQDPQFLHLHKIRLGFGGDLDQPFHQIRHWIEWAWLCFHNHSLCTWLRT